MKRKGRYFRSLTIGMTGGEEVLVLRGKRKPSGKKEGGFIA